jgi:pyridoxamine 5'-phosphate oxidase
VTHAAAASDRALLEGDLAATWLEQFELWLAQSRHAAFPEPDAMVLATADGAARPSARTVLLKGCDARGFVFFTNLDSRKGKELAQNPHAALVFPWYAVHRQVVVTGEVSELDAEGSDAYFASRPYGSRIAAHASEQSRVVAERAALDRAQAELERRFPAASPVPRPQYWGGLRLEPDSVEFWQGRRDRLHDRLRYRRDDASGSWLIERLAP